MCRKNILYDIYKRKLLTTRCYGFRKKKLVLYVIYKICRSRSRCRYLKYSRLYVTRTSITVNNNWGFVNKKKKNITLIKHVSVLNGLISNFKGSRILHTFDDCDIITNETLIILIDKVKYGEKFNLTLII